MIALGTWLTRLAWARTEERFSAADPWNDERPTVFTLESYVPALTRKPVGPWPQDRQLWVSAFTRALRSHTDGAVHLLPESLSELWLTGRVPAQSLPRLLKEIEPFLNEFDCRGTPASQSAFLTVTAELLGCVIALVAAIALPLTAHGPLWLALLVGGVILLVFGYPAYTIKKYRQKKQTRWFLDQIGRATSQGLPR